MEPATFDIMVMADIGGDTAASDRHGQPDSVLVVGPSWIGDMVISQSLFMLLRQRNPNVVIDVVAPGWSAPILARMPEVRRFLHLRAGHGELRIAERYRLGTSIRAQEYERAIVIPRSLKSALVPFFAGIPIRTGFRTEMRYGLLNDLRKLDRSILDQTIKRYIALAMPRDASLPDPPQPRLTINKENRSDVASRFELECNGSAVALMPGAAFGPAKRWPIEYFSQLATMLTAAGRQVWVLGSASEFEIGEEISAPAARSVRNLCGETSLEDTVDVLSAAGVAVTNDSGLMHVAAASQTHVLAVYGSSSPDYTPPLTKRKTILYQNLDCSPCFQRECPLGHLNCLRTITPELVFEKVQLALSGA